MPGVAAAAEGGQPGPVPGRAGHQQVGALARVGHAQPELVEQLHATRSDQVPAGLVPGEGRLVHQRDPGSAAGEHQGGHAAGRPGADNDRVVGAHRASTTATARVPVAQVK